MSTISVFSAVDKLSSETLFDYKSKTPSCACVHQRCVSNCR